MRDGFAKGQFKYHVDIVDGSENASKALIGILKGKSFAK